MFVLRCYAVKSISLQRLLGTEAYIVLGRKAVHDVPLVCSVTNAYIKSLKNLDYEIR